MRRTRGELTGRWLAVGEGLASTEYVGKNSSVFCWKFVILPGIGRCSVRRECLLLPRYYVGNNSMRPESPFDAKQRCHSHRIKN